MTGLIGICIWAVTILLSLRYHPEGRDSLVMMGMCFFCGLVVMLSGVGNLNITAIILSALAVILLILYCGQLRVQYNDNENFKEDLPDDGEGRGSKNIVA